MENHYLHTHQRLIIKIFVCLVFIQTCILNTPLQVLPSLSSSYPSLQEHTKLPAVLVQVWLHGDDDVHSSMSIYISCTYVSQFLYIGNQKNLLHNILFTACYC